MSELNSQFKNFIENDESSRGFLFALKGESNFSLFRLFYGIFRFIFSRRITIISPYRDQIIERIKFNYIRRLRQNEVETYPLDVVTEVIVNFEREYSVKESNFWNRNTMGLVKKMRYIQRAMAYQYALNNLNSTQLDSSIKNMGIKDEENTIWSPLEGSIQAISNGLIGILIVGLILWILAVVLNLFV